MYAFFFPNVKISVYRSNQNQASFVRTVEPQLKFNYADIGIEHYFNEEQNLAKIDPSITEDVKLDTVIWKSRIIMIELSTIFKVI